jgi:hypothetical protein
VHLLKQQTDFNTNTDERWMESNIRIKMMTTQTQMLIRQRLVGHGVRAKVHEHRRAQRQARQGSGIMYNKRVIITGKGVRFPWLARTKGCSKPFNREIII